MFFYSTVLSFYNTHDFSHTGMFFWYVFFQYGDVTFFIPRLFFGLYFFGTGLFKGKVHSDTRSFSTVKHRVYDSYSYFRIQSGFLTVKSFFGAFSKFLRAFTTK